jgi:hypothetical protein
MTQIIVSPGICGFETQVVVQKISSRKVTITIQSDCEKIKAYAANLLELDSFEIFKPLCDCKIYIEANRAKLHTNCLVPPGIIKAVEVASGFALPRDASIKFIIENVDRVGNKK